MKEASIDSFDSFTQGCPSFRFQNENDPGIVGVFCIQLLIIMHVEPPRAMSINILPRFRHSISRIRVPL